MTGWNWTYPSLCRSRLVTPDNRKGLLKTAIHDNNLVIQGPGETRPAVAAEALCCPRAEWLRAGTGTRLEAPRRENRAG